MNRRRFLECASAGGLALGAGGFLFVRRSQARDALTSKMLDDALPLLSTKATKELQDLPVQGREEIRRFFHGKCLNVESFVSHICSTPFGEQLGRCKTQEERQATLLAAFCGRVATEAEILNQVETIAAETGSELDAAWGRYCTELAAKWNTHIGAYGDLLTPDALTARVSTLIREDMAKAIREAASTGQPPALGQTVGKIGQSAVLLLPLVRFGKVGLAVGIPLFVFIAAKHVLDYVLAQLRDRRADAQSAISARVALLGNRVGAEFEREVRQRLTNLHWWQEQSIRESARRVAQERVGLI